MQTALGGGGDEVDKKKSNSEIIVGYPRVIASFTYNITVMIE